MSKEYIPMEMEDGSKLYIRAVDIGDDKQDIGDGKQSKASAASDVLNAMECIKKAMPQVGDFCHNVKNYLQEKVNADEIELEFSFSVTTDMSAIIASVAAEGSISVHLTWKKEEKK